MERTDRDVDEFLSTHEELGAIDAVIADVMEGHERELYEGIFWGGTHQEIIGYGRQDSTRRDGTPVEWFVVGLAEQRKHLSLYVSAVEDGKYLSEVLGPSLGEVRVGKSAITFRSAEALDLDALRTLIERARDATPPA